MPADGRGKFCPNKFGETNVH